VTADYDTRLDRVTAHMEERLDEPLDVEQLSEVAGLPPAHWHRLYHARRGETVLATFSRLRLQRAAEQLLHTSMSEQEIAEECGFRRLEAFARAFERACGSTPAKFRRYGGDCRIAAPEPPLARRCPVIVQPRPTWQAITLIHRGPFSDIGRTFDALDGWLVARGLRSSAGRAVGVFYDDPLLATAESELESRAGIVVAEDLQVEWPLEPLTLRARDYAVATFTGPLAEMRRAYQWLYGEWLPASGRWVADEPIVEEYVSDPRRLASGDVEVRIGVPLA
jgi:AraC family transcriptional regulator